MVRSGVRSRMTEEERQWVVWVAVAAAVGWWLLRGDVAGWRRAVNNPETTGMLILSLAVGVLIWMMAALDVDIPGFLDGAAFMLAFGSALTAAAVVLFGLRLLIVVVVERLRE